LRKFIWLLVGFILLEAILRLFGFGHLPIYHESVKYEYALEPDQAFTRFGNYFYINAAGMRSDELQQNEWRILKFGDSVLNGGIATDQSDLASNILQSGLKNEKKNLRVLNVSAGSWGPDNAFAWLKAHGHFDAEILVLLFSSHDWQDQMTFRDVVGRVPFYPEEQPFLAISDALHWSYSRLFDTVEWAELPTIRKAPPTGDHNLGWVRFLAFAERQNIPLVVYHHANVKEIEKDEWNDNGRLLQDFLKKNRITYTSGFEAGFEKDDYRDEIHPTDEGQAKIAAALQPILKKIIQNGQ
jgi:hypothetical protein